MQTLPCPSSAIDECEPLASSSLDASFARRDVKHSRILIVDDEPLNIDVVRTYLQLEGYAQIRSTSHALQTLALVGVFRPDLILLDIHMPGVDGLTILRRLRSDPKTATIPVVILTGSSTNETKLEALRHGATDLLAKPVHQAELLLRIRNVLAMKAHQDELCRYSEQLEAAVRQRTLELEVSRQEVIHCLARAAEFRDDDTGKHVVRVGRYARILGDELGLSEENLDILEQAAQLHDVGKIGIPDSILLKPSKLTAEEFAQMRKHCEYGHSIVRAEQSDAEHLICQHAEVGAAILESSKSPVLQVARQIALTHHERWDGRGYPNGLARLDIPLEGRLTAVADVFDALSSKRSYKPAFPLEQCYAILRSERGAHFDPAVVDAFFARLDAIVDVYISLADTE